MPKIQVLGFAWFKHEPTGRIFFPPPPRIKGLGLRAEGWEFRIKGFEFWDYEGV